MRPWAKAYSVFNLAKVDGYSPPADDFPRLDEAGRIAQAKAARSRPRAARQSMSSTLADCRIPANFSRDRMRRSSRPVASRSTSRAKRSSKPKPSKSG